MQVAFHNLPKFLYIMNQVKNANSPKKTNTKKGKSSTNFMILKNTCENISLHIECISGASYQDMIYPRVFLTIFCSLEI